MATTSENPIRLTHENVLDVPTGPGTKTTMIIEGVEYDVTEWKMKHPGGFEILEKYHEKDATEVFYAFHRPETLKMLNALPSKTPKTQPFVSDKLKKFREFRRKLVDMGYMKRCYSWYAYKTVTTLALCATAVVLAFTGNWLLSALVMGLFWQQAGWLSHEYAHHQVFDSRTFNNAFVYLSSNILQGFSVNWWKDRHNSHHAITNVLEVDPDVQNLPLFVWDIKDIPLIHPHDRPKLKLAMNLVPYQHYYWVPFTPLLRIIWMLQSFLYSKGLKDHASPVLRRTYNFEYPLILSHHVLVGLLMYFTMPSISAAVSWWLISNCLGGALIAWIVFTSHYACDLYDPNDRCQLNFLDLQLYTTRNIKPGVFMDWFAGGLNYQIEHHLFPQMPRCRMYEVSLLTRQFCKENDLPYQCETLPVCIQYLLERLATVAHAWKKQVLNK